MKQCCRAEEPKLKLPPGAGAEITNCGSGSNSGSFLFIKDLKNFYLKKIMVDKEVFLNYLNFYPLWLQHASVHVKKVLVLKSKEANGQGFFYKIYSEPGLEPERKK